MSDLEFNEMLVGHSDYLKPYAFTLTRDADAAGDLLQETMYRAMVNKEKYNAGTNIKAWIYTIMRNIFINDYRKQKRYRVVSSEDVTETTINAARTVANNAPGQLQWKDIQHAIHCLPDMFRQPFVLYYEGYRYNEISEALTVPLGTIKSRIHFSRKMLRAQLEQG